MTAGQALLAAGEPAGAEEALCAALQYELPRKTDSRIRSSAASEPPGTPDSTTSCWRVNQIMQWAAGLDNEGCAVVVSASAAAVVVAAGVANASCGDRVWRSRRVTDFPFV